MKGVGPVRSSAPSRGRFIPRAAPTLIAPYPFESDEEAAAFEERAAIREFDGGLSRSAAERLAWLDTLNARDANPRSGE
jgi:hypothetical protein